VYAEEREKYSCRERLNTAIVERMGTRSELGKRERRGECRREEYWCGRLGVRWEERCSERAEKEQQAMGEKQGEAKSMQVEMERGRAENG